MGDYVFFVSVILSLLVAAKGKISRFISHRRLKIQINIQIYKYLVKVQSKLLRKSRDINSRHSKEMLSSSI